MTFLELYHRYADEVGAIDSNIYGYSHFLTLLHTEYPEITKCRQSSFAQCSLCSALAATINNASLSAEQRAMATQLRSTHFDQVQRDREAFLDREAFASQPGSLVCEWGVGI